MTGDPEKKARQAERARKYRRGLSEGQRQKQRELAKRRQRRFRERKREREKCNMMTDCENTQCDDTAAKMSPVLEESCPPMADKEYKVVTMSNRSKQEKGSEQGDQEEDKTSDADYCWSYDKSMYASQIEDIVDRHRNKPDLMEEDCEPSPGILQSMDQPPKGDKQFVGSSDGASSTSESGYQGNGAGLRSVGWGAADDGDDEEPPNHSCHSHILSQCEASTSFQKQSVKERHFEAYLRSPEEPMTDLQLTVDESDDETGSKTTMDPQQEAQGAASAQPLVSTLPSMAGQEQWLGGEGAYSNEASPPSSLNISRNPPSNHDKNHQQAVAVNDELMTESQVQPVSEPQSKATSDNGQGPRRRPRHAARTKPASPATDNYARCPVTPDQPTTHPAAPIQPTTHPSAPDQPTTHQAATTPPTTRLRIKVMDDQQFQVMLLALSKEVSSGSVMDLGLCLNFSTAVVNRFIQTNMRLVEVTAEGTHSMLRTWYDKIPQRKAGEMLTDALIGAELYRLAEKFLLDVEND